MDELERSACKEASSEAYGYAIFLLIVYTGLDFFITGGSGGSKYLLLLLAFLSLYWWRKKRKALHRYLDGSGEKVSLNGFDALQLGLVLVAFVLYTVLAFLG